MEEKASDAKVKFLGGHVEALVKETISCGVSRGEVIELFLTYWEKEQKKILESKEQLKKKEERNEKILSYPMEEFIKNTPGNGMFLYSCYQNYTNQDIIQFLKQQGLEVKEERGNRIFPITDKSQDVLNCFIKKMKELKILYLKYYIFQKNFAKFSKNT